MSEWLPANGRRYASVIVVAYNSRADLPACLDSIIGELGPQDELIVIDNGSIDGSADLVCSHYPQARLLRAENCGYAGGNNRGAAIARGDYLLFLNPDTILAPGALEALLAPLHADAQIGLTTACIVHRDRPNTINTCGNTMHYTGLTYCRGAGRPRAEFADSADVDAVSGAAFAIRRDLFEELDGFDERFFMYAEDSDLSWRARLDGYRCRYVAEALVAHNYRPGYSPAKAFYLDRNRHLMLLKNLRRATYIRALPALLLGEIITGGFLLLQGPRYWAVKPRVYRWLWVQRATIRATHCSMWRARTQDDRAILGRMTYRLEFEQLASRALAEMASFVFHPAFWALRWLFAGKTGVPAYPDTR